MEEQSIDSWILTIDFYCFDFTAGRFWIGPCQVRPYQDVFERSSDSLVPSARCPPRLYRVLDAYRYVVRIVCWKTLLLLPFFPVQLSFVLSLLHITCHSIPLLYTYIDSAMCVWKPPWPPPPLSWRRTPFISHGISIMFSFFLFEQWQQ